MDLCGMGTLGSGVPERLVPYCFPSEPYHATCRDLNRNTGKARLMHGSAQTVFEVSGEGLVSEAVRSLQDPKDAGVTYHIKASPTLLSQSSNTILISPGTNQTKVRHLKEQTGWHLLWPISLFPTGTEYLTVERSGGTVNDPTFYTDFFNSLDTALKDVSPPSSGVSPKMR